MIKIEKTDVWGFEHAVRGVRNPLNSWDKTDSVFSENKDDFFIGKDDMSLMCRLIKSGPEHRKFMRQIFVAADIVGPIYFWKEFDQYKISTTTDSCSTMHTIHKKKFEPDDFSREHLFNIQRLCTIVDWLNDYRDIYLNWDDKKPFYRDDDNSPVTKKDVWWQLIQLLPSSYNQKRTWTGNYENLLTMYHQRKNHKLDEWHDFCDWIESLPYMKEFLEAAYGQDTEA